MYTFLKFLTNYVIFPYPSGFFKDAVYYYSGFKIKNNLFHKIGVHSPPNSPQDGNRRRYFYSIYNTKYLETSE